MFCKSSHNKPPLKIQRVIYCIVKTIFKVKYNDQTHLWKRVYLSLLQVLRGRFLSRGDRDIQTLSFPPWVTSNLLWTHRIEIIRYSYFAKLNTLQIALLSSFSLSWMPRVYFLELCKVRKHFTLFFNVLIIWSGEWPNGFYISTACSFAKFCLVLVINMYGFLALSSPFHKC